MFAVRARNGRPRIRENPPHKAPSRKFQSEIGPTRRPPASTPAAGPDTWMHLEASLLAPQPCYQGAPPNLTRRAAEWA